MAARLVLATRNKGKVSELQALLSDVGLRMHEIIGADTVPGPDPVEDGVTFEENALIKAREICRRTGLPAVADDSGLSVDILGGAPGIFSARWAGRHGDDQANLELLLAQLGDIAPEHRGAGFVCAAALVTPDGEETVTTGRLDGVLATSPRGEGGFGYDPILIPVGETRTCAELEPAEKNAISHRGIALRQLVPAIAHAIGR